jgi:hypothetical protein
MKCMLSAIILVALTATANAQRESGNYMGGFAGTGILGSIPKREVCQWSAAPGERAWCQRAQQPRVKSWRIKEQPR